MNATILSFERGQKVLRGPGVSTAAHWRLNKRNHPITPLAEGVEPWMPPPPRYA